MKWRENRKMENRAEIIKQFNAVAEQYDNQRRKLIPCFKDFYTIASSLATTSTVSPRILDLGAGTGLFSSFIINQFPKASFTLIDISEQMINVAKQRFSNLDNITYIIEDYTNYDQEETYDIIISSLSIHHLTDEQKYKLYNQVFKNLKSGGIFINADQVLGETEVLDQLYKQDWLAKVTATDLTEEELTAAIKRTELDKMATLSSQLSSLNKIGFSHVDCVYKYMNFVVLYAQKL